MNQRIKELEAECWDYARGIVNTQKFAELIVRECAEVAHCNFHVDGLTLGGILKEHFGVKE
jgi:hypothetical protein